MVTSAETSATADRSNAIHRTRKKLRTPRIIMRFGVETWGMKRRTDLGFFLGLILGLILVPAGAYLYFASGSAPVATTDPMMPMETTLARKALSARIDKEMPKKVPIAADEAAFMAGAEVYRSDCAVCHGFPGMAQGSIAKGMFPEPPHLFRGKGVTDDEPGETS